MALPGVYTKAEQKMLESWEAVEQENIGWLGDDPVPGKIELPVSQRVVTKDAILYRANCMGDANPLWRDENYARQTRWGGIIAPPSFACSITYQGPVSLRMIPLEVGYAVPWDRGMPSRTYSAMWGFLGCWEYFKPIHVGDSFRVWCGPNTHEDVTGKDGKGARSFRIDDQLRFYNQKSELVAIFHKRQLFKIISPEEASLIKMKSNLGEYRYSKEELEYLENMRNNEIIRGAEIRWWEDVKLDEELKPVAKGPINVWDQVKAIISSESPRRERVQTLKPQFSGKAVQGVDPETGVWHYPLEAHLSDKLAQLAGFPQPIAFMYIWIDSLNRVVTNWMGNDGFLKRAEWKRFDDMFLGDAAIARGKVVRKYVKDDGEHVVDLSCWLEDIRGYIVNGGLATVGLLSKESLPEDLQRY
jgi:acyl dehydratase